MNCIENLEFGFAKFLYWQRDLGVSDYCVKNS